MGDSSPMQYVMEMSAAIIAVAFIVPTAFSYLFNGSSWGTTPAVVVTLGTTVLAIFVVLGLMLKFMPQSLKQKIGMWTVPYPTVKATSFSVRNKKTISAQNHFEV